MSASVARPSLFVSLLWGLAQILAWGGSFYLMAVLADPVVRDTGWPRQWVYGALSLGILVSGLLAPLVARRLERHGGRRMLLASVPVLVIGLLGVAAAPNLWCFLLAWLVIGVGMAAGLYDALFATFGQLFGKDARWAITQVTLISGFSTAITWPLQAWMIDVLGWRWACVAYAALLLACTLPIYARTLPAHTPAPKAERHDPSSQATLPGGAVFWLMTTGFTLAAVIMTAISVQLIDLLQARGQSLAGAIAIAALIGPSQVGARVLQVLMGRSAHPWFSTLASVTLVSLGLAGVVLLPQWAGLCIVVYGLGSGLRSIVRGTLPLSLFGTEVYARVLGRIARPTLIAQAATPLIGGWLQAHLGANPTLTILLALAVANLLVVLVLGYRVRHRLHERG